MDSITPSAASDAVEDGLDAAVRRQYFKCGVEGVALVYDYGEAHIPGLGELTVESLHLGVGECAVPIEVDTDFSDGYIVCAVGKHRHHVAELFAPVLLDLGGVQTHSESRIGGSQRVKCFHRPDAAAVYGGEHHHVYSGGYGAVYGLGLTLHGVGSRILYVEFRPVDMCMCVYHGLMGTG